MAKTNKQHTIEELTQKLYKKIGATPKSPEDQLKEMLKKI
jgi:hypothetical protein